MAAQKKNSQENLESDVVIDENISRTNTNQQRMDYLSPIIQNKQGFGVQFIPSVNSINDTSKVGGGALQALKEKLSQAYQNAGLPKGSIIVQNVKESQVSLNEVANFRQNSNRTNFSYNHGLVVINLKECKILKVIGLFQKTNFFCECSCQGVRIKSKSNNLGGKNPNFHQTLEMQVKDNSDALVVKLIDQCQEASYEKGVIGQVEVELKELNRKTSVGVQPFQLKSPEGKLTAVLQAEIIYLPPINKSNNNILSQEGEEMLHLNDELVRNHFDESSQENFKSEVEFKIPYNVSSKERSNSVKKSDGIPRSDSESPPLSRFNSPQLQSPAQLNFTLNPNPQQSSSFNKQINQGSKTSELKKISSNESLPAQPHITLEELADGNTQKQLTLNTQQLSQFQSNQAQLLAAGGLENAKNKHRSQMPLITEHIDELKHTSSYKGQSSNVEAKESADSHKYEDFSRLNPPQINILPLDPENKLGQKQKPIAVKSKGKLSPPPPKSLEEGLQAPSMTKEQKAKQFGFKPEKRPKNGSPRYDHINSGGFEDNAAGENQFSMVSISGSGSGSGSGENNEVPSPPVNKKVENPQAQPNNQPQQFLHQEIKLVRELDQKKLEQLTAKLSPRLQGMQTQEQQHLPHQFSVQQSGALKSQKTMPKEGSTSVASQIKNQGSSLERQRIQNQLERLREQKELMALKMKAIEKGITMPVPGIPQQEGQTGGQLSLREQAKAKMEAAKNKYQQKSSPDTRAKQHKPEIKEKIIFNKDGTQRRKSFVKRNSIMVRRPSDQALALTPLPTPPPDSEEKQDKLTQLALFEAPISEVTETSKATSVTVSKKRYKSNPHSRPQPQPTSEVQKSPSLEDEIQVVKKPKPKKHPKLINPSNIDGSTKIDQIQKNIQESKSQLKKMMRDPAQDANSKEKLPDIKQQESKIAKENEQLRSQLKLLNSYLDDVCEFIKEYNLKSKKPKTNQQKQQQQYQLQINIKSVEYDLHFSSSSMSPNRAVDVSLPSIYQSQSPPQVPEKNQMSQQEVDRLLKLKSDELKNQEKSFKNFFAEYERLKRQYERISDPSYLENLKRQNMELEQRFRSVEKEKKTLDAENQRRDKNLDRMLKVEDSNADKETSLLAQEVEKVKKLLKQKQDQLAKLHQKYSSELKKQEEQAHKKKDLSQRVKQAEQFAAKAENKNKKARLKEKSALSQVQSKEDLGTQNTDGNDKNLNFIPAYSDEDAEGVEEMDVAEELRDRKSQQILHMDEEVADQVEEQQSFHLHQENQSNNILKANSKELTSLGLSVEKQSTQKSKGSEKGDTNKPVLIKNFKRVIEENEAEQQVGVKKIKNRETVQRYKKKLEERIEKTSRAQDKYVASKEKTLKDLISKNVELLASYQFKQQQLVEREQEIEELRKQLKQKKKSLKLDDSDYENQLNKIRADGIQSQQLSPYSSSMASDPLPGIKKLKKKNSRSVIQDASHFSQDVGAEHPKKAASQASDLYEDEQASTLLVNLKMKKSKSKGKSSTLGKIKKSPLTIDSSTQSHSKLKVSHNQTTKNDLQLPYINTKQDIVEVYLQNNNFINNLTNASTLLGPLGVPSIGAPYQLNLNKDHSSKLSNASTIEKSGRKYQNAKQILEMIGHHQEKLQGMRNKGDNKRVQTHRNNSKVAKTQLPSPVRDDYDINPKLRDISALRGREGNIKVNLKQKLIINNISGDQSLDFLEKIQERLQQMQN